MRFERLLDPLARLEVSETFRIDLSALLCQLDCLEHIGARDHDDAIDVCEEDVGRVNDETGERRVCGFVWVRIRLRCVDGDALPLSADSREGALSERRVASGEDGHLSVPMLLEVPTSAVEDDAFYASRLRTGSHQSAPHGVACIRRSGDQQDGILGRSIDKVDLRLGRSSAVCRCNHLYGEDLAAEFGR